MFKMLVTKIQMLKLIQLKTNEIVTNERCVCVCVYNSMKTPQLFLQVKIS